MPAWSFVQDRKAKERVAGAMGEPIVLADGSVGRVLRNEIIAEVCDVPTRRQTQTLLDEKLRNFNPGMYKPQAIVMFKEFVQDYWTPKVLPTFKPSTA